MAAHTAYAALVSALELCQDWEVRPPSFVAAAVGLVPVDQSERDEFESVAVLETSAY